MYIVDTHCDSLLKVNCDRGLVNAHNVSAKHPHLQLFAEFVPHQGMSPEYRRRRIFGLLEVYMAECQRLGIMPVRDCQELNYAIEHDMNSAILAIEGGAASGKTTLAETLRKIYGCNVFHMDDFFLRPEQRTAQRLSAPGENVDHERFLEEVLTPLKEGRSVTFRRYDCHTQSLCPAVTVPPAPLTVVEGSYCCHDSLYDAYGLRCFLRISPELQRRRIEGRNSPEFQQRFFETWIPMEQRYHQAFSIPERCDIILEVPT